MAPSTENAMIVHEQKALIGAEGMKALQETAKQVFVSGLCPKSVQKWEQVLVIGLYGRELGLPLIRAVNEIHVIDGHPGISAKLMNIKVRENLPAAKVDILEKTAKICRIRFQRSPAHQPVEISYTIDEAKEANLLFKDNWKKYPADMLFARCFSRMVRQECPEAVHGFVHTPEELEVPLQRAEVVPAKADENAPVKADPKVVEAELAGAQAEGEPLNEDAAMEFIAAIADVNEEAELEKLHRDFADYWMKKSPATAAEAYGQYKKRLQRLRDSKAGRNA